MWCSCRVVIFSCCHIIFERGRFYCDSYSFALAVSSESDMHDRHKTKKLVTFRLLPVTPTEHLNANLRSIPYQECVALISGVVNNYGGDFQSIGECDG